MRPSPAYPGWAQTRQHNPFAVGLEHAARGKAADVWEGRGGEVCVRREVLAVLWHRVGWEEKERSGKQEMRAKEPTRARKSWVLHLRGTGGSQAGAPGPGVRL